MKEVKLSTKKPIAALAIWLAIVFVFTALFTSISLLLNSKDKFKNSYSDTQIEYMGKILADERFAEPIAEVTAENEIVATKVENAVSISSAFESDFNTYLVKTDSTVTSVNPLNSEDDVSGSGTQDDPYLVKTLHGWLWIENLIQYTPVQYRYITLANDIDFDGYILDIVGSTGSCFVGVFDGNNFTLKNLIIKGSLFSGIGAGFGDSGVTIYEQYNSAVKNLNVDCIAVSTGSEEPSAVLAGIPAYNVIINNCSFDLFSYNVRYAIAVSGYMLGGMEVSDCYFNLRSKNANCMAMGYALGKQMLGIELNNESVVVDNCIIDVNIHTSQDDPFGVVMMGAYGGDLIVQNCKTYGDYTSTGSPGDGTYMCGYLNFISFPGGYDTYIKNCENHINFAMNGPIGGFVGNVLAQDENSADNPNSKLYIQNCSNYGDAYSTYSGGTVSLSDMALSGFVGYAEGDTTTTLENCKNYGSQYGGSFMAGFISYLQAKAVVKNCDNYGSINYAFGFFIGGTIAGIAAISTEKCYKMAERSILIDNCSFVGKVVNKPYTEDRFNHDTDGYLNQYLAGICSVGVANFNTTDAFVKEIIIQNCFVDFEIIGLQSLYVCPILQCGIGASYDTNSVVLLDNNIAVTTFRGEPISSIGCFVFDKVTPETGSADKKCPANYTNSNNYYEVNAINSIGCLGYNGTGGDSDSNGYYTSGNLNFWNNQISMNIKYTQEFFDETLKGGISISGSLMVVDMFDYQKGDSANISIKDISYSINLNVQTTSQIEGSNNIVEKRYVDYDLSDYSDFNYDLNDYSNNVVLTYNSNVEGDAAEKYYYHSDETVEKFGADKWFYCPELNGGRPMLRQFFHLAKYYTEQDCFARLEELGYNKYVASSGA